MSIVFSTICLIRTARTAYKHRQTIDLRTQNSLPIKLCSFARALLTKKAQLFSCKKKYSLSAHHGLHLLGQEEIVEKSYCRDDHRLMSCMQQSFTWTVKVIHITGIVPHSNLQNREFYQKNYHNALDTTTEGSRHVRLPPSAAKLQYNYSSKPGYM